MHIPRSRKEPEVCIKLVCIFSAFALGLTLVLNSPPSFTEGRRRGDLGIDWYRWWMDGCLLISGSSFSYLCTVIPVLSCCTSSNMELIYSALLVAATVTLRLRVKLPLKSLDMAVISVMTVYPSRIHVFGQRHRPLDGLSLRLIPTYLTCLLPVAQPLRAYQPAVNFKWPHDEKICITQSKMTHFWGFLALETPSKDTWCFFSNSAVLFESKPNKQLITES